MIQAVLRRKLNLRRHTVDSAGVLRGAGAGNLASVGSQVAAAAEGLDLSSHRSQFAGYLKLDQYDRILCTKDANENLLAMPGVDPERVTVLDIPNPWQQSQLAYNRCLCEIDEQIDRWLESRGFTETNA